MRSIGAELREAREAAGKSIEDVARRTRVAPEYLRAIEEENWEQLPVGPYRDAWVRAYCSHLRVPEPEHAAELQHPGVPLWIPRVIGAGMVFGALALMGGLIVAQRVMPASTPDQPAKPEQLVSVYARRDVPITVRTDGEVVFAKTLHGKQTKKFLAFERIEIDVPSVELVRLSFNRMSLIPQGRQDTPRKLVFIDDQRR